MASEASVPATTGGPDLAMRTSTGDGDALPVLSSLADLTEVVRGNDELHVRFSRGPRHDRAGTSRDYESGLELPGLSANPMTPEAWWTRPLRDWIARQLCQYVHLLEGARDERVAWLLTGTEVARGPDNEPLLADVEPLALIAHSVLEEAKECYREHFDVGRDSTG